MCVYIIHGLCNVALGYSVKDDLKYIFFKNIQNVFSYIKIFFMIKKYLENSVSYLV